MIANGRMVENGTHDELLASGLVYPRLIAAQIDTNGADGVDGDAESHGADGAGAALDRAIGTSDRLAKILDGSGDDVGILVARLKADLAELVRASR